MAFNTYPARNCCGNVNGLGAVSASDAQDVALKYINNLSLTEWAALAANIATGDRSLLAKHAANIAEEICTYGFYDKMKQYWYVFAIVILGAYLLMKKK